MDVTKDKMVPRMSCCEQAGCKGSGKHRERLEDGLSVCCQTACYANTQKFLGEEHFK